MPPNDDLNLIIFQCLMLVAERFSLVTDYQNLQKFRFIYQQNINTKKEGTSAYCKKPSGSVGERRGLNPRHAEPQSAALPTELRSP